MNNKQVAKKRIHASYLSIMLIVVLLSGSPLKAEAEEYEYDELNRVKKVIYDDGSYVEYTYDKNGNILNIVVFDAAEDETEEPGESVESGGQGESDESKDADPSEDSKEAESGTPDSPAAPGVLGQIIEAIGNFFEKIGEFIRNIFR